MTPSSPFGYFEVCAYRFAPDLNQIAVALKQMEQNLLGRGFDSKIWSDIELATAEALNNAVEHGCKDCPDAFVELSWQFMQTSIEVWVSDPSENFPQQVDATLPQDPWQEEGRGHFLMAQMMDSVDHFITPQRHIVRMVKHIPSSMASASSLVEMQQMVQSLTEELSCNYETVTTLLKFSEILASSSDFFKFADDACRHLLSFMSADQVFLRIVNEQRQLELVRATTVSREAIHHALSLDLLCAETRVFEKGQDATLEDLSILPQEDPLHGKAQRAFITPVFFQNKTIGVLVVLANKMEEYFSATQTHLARVIAEFFGIAYTTSKLQEERHRQQRAMQELEIAAEIQQSLLPRDFPETTSYRIFGLNQPAQQVGGDYFDVIQLPDRSGIFLLIADVMGKGLPAALLATVLRTAIHAHLQELNNPPRLLQAINKQIYQDLSNLEMFITVQAVYISYRDKQLIFSSAGHCPLVHYNAKQGVVESLCANGLPMGINEEEAYPHAQINIQSGDRFVLITDGLYEVTSEKGEMIGVDGLCSQIPKLWTGPPIVFCSNMLAFVRDYSNYAAASDDRTLIAFEYLE